MIDMLINMFTLLMLRIKLVLIAVLSVAVVAGSFWIKHLWSENASLEVRIQTIQQEYDALKQSNQESIDAVSKACLEDAKAKDTTARLKNRLKTTKHSVKTALESSNEGQVIPTYTRGNLNGSEGLKTRTNGDNNEERFVSLDDKLNPAVTGVLNNAYCEASGSGDSCLPSDTVSN